MRNGFGDPPLCRMHVLVVDFEVDLEDPVGSLLEMGDRFLSQQHGPLVQGFAQALGQLLRPQTPQGYPQPPDRANVRGGSPPPRPPPRAAPPPPPPKEDPLDVLGFAPGTKLTRVMVKERQRALAALMHPDRGGSTRALQRLNGAAQELLAGLK